MADRSKIEWTDATLNPIRARNRATGKVGWHCTHESEGCRFCYAEKRNINTFYGNGLPYKPGHEKDIEIFLDEKMLTKPLRWRQPRKIFVGSMTDLFADFVRDDMLDKTFAVAALCPQHTFIVLTKRARRMREYMTAIDTPARIASDGLHEVTIGFPARGPLIFNATWPLPNVWLGVSCEDQANADARVPDLLATPAAVRFVSAEPLLGPIDFENIDYYVFLDSLHKKPRPDPQSPNWPMCRYDTLRGHLKGPDDVGLPKLDWIIVGGESGPKARGLLRAWEAAIRGQCEAAGVAYFRKQWGEYIDADLWLAACAPAKFYDGMRGLRAPLNFDDAAIVARIGGYRYEHQADGTTLIRVGKQRAGRTLDGATHDAFPEMFARASG